MSLSLQTRILEVGVSTTFGSANLPEYSQRSSVLLSIPRALATWSVEYSAITCITIGVFTGLCQVTGQPVELKNVGECRRPRSLDSCLRPSNRHVGWKCHLDEHSDEKVGDFVDALWHDGRTKSE